MFLDVFNFLGSTVALEGKTLNVLHCCKWTRTKQMNANQALPKTSVQSKSNTANNVALSCPVRYITIELSVLTDVRHL